MDIKWIKDGKVEIGGFCTAQGKLIICYVIRSSYFSRAGVIQQLGETGVAITTLVNTIKLC